MTLPAQDSQGLSIDSPIELFQLSLVPIGGSEIFYFVNWKDTGGLQVVFQGITYTAIPIKIQGISKLVKGQLPSPKIEVGNILGIISSIAITNKDLVGAKLIRKKTFVKYLDGHPQANPAVEYVPSVWIVRRKVSENRKSVVFELKASHDLGDQTYLPSSTIMKHTCIWRYRDPTTCGYTGGAVADKFNNPTSDMSLDDCSLDIRGCKYRFGNFGVLRGRFFPGVDM